MAHAGEVFVLVAGPGIDVYTDAREMTRQGLCCDSDAIREGGYLVKFDRILSIVSRMKTVDDAA
jgi:hypothetical protein